MAEVVGDISTSLKALGSTVERRSFKRRILLHFARNLPPMERIVQATGGNALVGQDDKQNDHAAVITRIGVGEQPGLLENDKGEPETQIIGSNCPDDVSQRIHEWLYAMGLSPEALSRMVSAFVWMVLPFIGQ